MYYLTNAFSLNMLTSDEEVSFIKLKTRGAEQLLSEGGFESFIGHQDTANVVGSVLGIEVPMHRGTLTIGKDDQLIVAQYKGPRLPEGTKTLPEGATIEFWLVTVEP